MAAGRTVALRIELSMSWLLVVLFECGIEISRIDRHHLLCLAIHADRRQVNEGADTSPGKAGGCLRCSSSSWSTR